MLRAADSPVTARVIVFGEMDEAVAGLAQAISAGQAGKTLYPALRVLSAATRDAAIREISTFGAGLLELDLSNLLVMGAMPGLLAAATRSVAERAAKLRIVVDRSQSD